MFRSGRFASSLTLATIVFAIGLYLFLPPGVIAWDDGFGYLRSVVLTIQNGYPTTHDWLEPWAATQSALSALIFGATGSFSTAILVPQILGGAGVFAAAALLLRDRGYGIGLVLAITALFATMPVILFRWGELSAITLYLPCFVAALWGADRGRWWQFFLFWAIAVATRQSAIAWLALPAWHAATLYLRELRAAGSTVTGLRRGIAAIRPFLIWLCFAMLLIVVLAVGMNQTHSQTMVTANVFREFDLRAFARSATAGVSVLVIAIGLGGLTLAVAERQPLFGAWRREKFLLSLVGFAVAALLVFGWQRIGIGGGGWSFGYSGRIYVGLCILLVLTGWLTGVPRLDMRYLFAGAVCILLVSFRRVLYDYYFIDVFAFGFLAVLGRPQASAAVSSPTPMEKVVKSLIPAALVLLALLQGYFAVMLKSTFDRAYGITALAEQAMRQGKLAPTELVFAPFGYQGWKLHSYFIAHEGKNDRFIAGFINYFDVWSITVVDRNFLRRTVQAARSGTVVAEGSFSEAPLAGKLTLIRHEGSGLESSPLKRSIAKAADPFPLNDQEWRAFIHRKPVAAP